MTELDRLPPDQRAVLSLVLDRGKSYAEVAELLGIPENTVRDRAHTALDALAEGVTAPAGSRTGSGRGARPGAESGLGERHGATGARSATAASRSTVAGTGSGPARAGAGASSAPPPRPREPRSAQTSAGSRRAGALLLGAIVVVIVVVVVLVSSGGGKGSTPPTTAASTPTTTTGSGSGTSSTSTTSTTKPRLDSTIRLSSPEPSHESRRRRVRALGRQQTRVLYHRARPATIIWLLLCGVAVQLAVERRAARPCLERELERRNEGRQPAA